MPAVLPVTMRTCSLRATSGWRARVRATFDGSTAATTLINSAALVVDGNSTLRACTSALTVVVVFWTVTPLTFAPTVRVPTANSGMPLLQK